VAYQIKGTVSFDLSHIGMMISNSLAYSHLEELAIAAQENDIQLMISMEESQKTIKFYPFIRIFQNYTHMLG
jgi:proline dehydrogenase